MGTDETDFGREAVTLFLDRPSAATGLSLVAEKKAAAEEFEVFYDPFNGLSCGEMLSFGDPDLPGEQRFFNHPQLTWYSEAPLDEPMEIVGFPLFRFEAFAVTNDTEGYLAVKLCDVFPDGSSRLISLGVQNLCEIFTLDERGFGKEQHVSLEKGKRYELYM